MAEKRNVQTYRRKRGIGMIRAIIFDCFGVVVTDTLPAAYKRLGGDFEKDVKTVGAIIDAANKGIIPRSTGAVAELLGVSESTWIQAMAEGRVRNLELLEYIKELRTTYKTAMLSNVSAGGLERLFEDGFLEKYFDVVIASATEGFAKPEARAYEITAERLGVRLDECIFTDDREPYAEGAQHVGMKTILFKNTDQFVSELQALLQ
jgi:beta-phosphoglucomutase-like phosphatase (HAD superfamily)